MSNIYVNLDLPVNVAIKFNFVPRPLRTRAARKLEEQRLCAEVRRAIQRWCYETYC